MLNDRSRRNLQGVHPRLVAVIEAAAAKLPLSGGLGFVVTEGLRTPARQAQLVAAGASRTSNSRHLTGHAVDIAATINGQVRWDWPLYQRLADLIVAEGQRLGTPITWGGNWRSLRDGPHFEIDPRTFAHTA
jgi:peptidoglycan L-alanyl-D-glutamate endopeptidase CwlK